MLILDILLIASGLWLDQHSHPLNLSAAFISDSILLTWLSNHLGITDTALFSVLTLWAQSICHSWWQSLTPCPRCVPQGSVLGPLVFNIYMPLFGDIIHHSGLNFHSYAHHTQLYISTKPSEGIRHAKAVSRVSLLLFWFTLTSSFSLKKL